MSSDKFTISILSEDIPYIPEAVHNAILIRKNGEPFALFNGQAHSRETGEPINFTDDSTNTLRVRVLDAKERLEQYEEHEINTTETVLWEGPEAEGNLMIANMAEAALYMNSQNLPYVLVDPFSMGQNSNSVARTLVEAAGLEYPYEVELMWAPGDQRVLLPSDWDTEFSQRGRAFSFDVSDLYGELYVQTQFERIKSDPPRTDMDAQSLYFNPDKPFNPDAHPLRRHNQQESPTTEPVDPFADCKQDPNCEAVPFTVPGR